MEISPLIPVGTKIRIEKSKIQNEMPRKLINSLPKLIIGEVIDYKMTDGMSIGYVLITENNLKIWIFNNELNDQTKREYNIYETKKSTNLLTKELISRIYKIDYKINGNRKIKTIANPINLFSWLTFTLKDIF